MAKQKFGLGRGLDALISGASEVMAAQQSSRVDEENILQIPIDALIPNPRQPRRMLTEDDPKLLELSASIKQYGLLQPLVVTRLDTDSALTVASQKATANDFWFGEEDQKGEVLSTSSTSETVIRFQIIAGERRWRASRMAGLTKVPVVLKEATPQEMLELALIENIQRADLNPIEEAFAYQALIQEFGLTQEMVAKAVGKDRSTITNAIRLLTLAPKVREALINQYENFSEGHARALAGINREEDQVAAMGKIITLKLNVRQAEELAAHIKAAERADIASQKISASPPRRSPELDDLETQFRNALLVKVDLKRSAKGKGTLVLHFNNQDELERLYTRLVKHEE
ncbi:MAG TPA: ParB/RepB/Spo0J family partition protein [Ktedonobacteraceae bacterium]